MIRVAYERGMILREPGLDAASLNLTFPNMCSRGRISELNIFSCSRAWTGVIVSHTTGLTPASLTCANLPAFVMQLNVIYSLLTGRLVREKVDPAVQRVVRSQVC